MQAVCEIQITQQNVQIEIRKGHENLLVFIDDIEQSAEQNSCELKIIFNLAFEMLCLIFILQLNSKIIRH